MRGFGERFGEGGGEPEDEFLKREVGSVGGLTDSFDGEGESSSVFVERKGIVCTPESLVVFV